MWGGEGHYRDWWVKIWGINSPFLLPCNGLTIQEYMFCAHFQFVIFTLYVPIWSITKQRSQQLLFQCCFHTCIGFQFSKPHLCPAVSFQFLSWEFPFNSFYSWRLLYMAIDMQTERRRMQAYRGQGWGQIEYSGQRTTGDVAGGAGATVKQKACLLGSQGSFYLPPKDCLGFIPSTSK